MSRPLLLAALLPLTLLGCAARSTLQIVQAEQAIYLAREAEAPERAVYEWTLAEQYMQKAREEWSHSDYGPADQFARKAVDWAGKAELAAAEGQSYERVEASPDVVPEERAPSGMPEPGVDEGGDSEDPPWGMEEESRGVEHETIEIPVFDEEEEE